MENKFLSVPEFANLTNRSKQAIYSRLKTDLNEYKKIIDGQIYIDPICLSMFDQVDSQLDQDLTLVDQVGGNIDQVTNLIDQENIKRLSEELIVATSQNKDLINELKLKDSLIKSLNKEIDNLKDRLDQSELRFDKQLTALQESLNRKEQEYVKLVERQSASLNSKDEDIGLLIDKLTLLFDQQQKLNLQQQTFLSNGNQPDQEKKSLWQRIFNK